MVKNSNGIIEIIPGSNGIPFIMNDKIIIDSTERTITSVQVYNPITEKKYYDIFAKYKKYYGVVLNAAVMEIITHPTKNSLSTKTCTYQLIYVNPLELNKDYDELKNSIRIYKD